jgi:hypothetical protein
MKIKHDDDELSVTIIRIAREKKPYNVKELCELVRQDLPVEESKVISAIIKLQDQSKLGLWHQPFSPTPSLMQYLKTNQARWYWITIVITLIAAIFTIAVTGDSYPLIYTRYALGALFALWLPGYAFTRVLYSVNSSTRTPSNNISFVERAALSLGMSIALVSIVGILLNYSPWGIRPTPLILSLLVLTLVFATIAVAKEFKSRDGS